jgi:putative ABC transport system ATP-binding protein
MAIIELKNLLKHYVMGAVTVKALRGVDLAFEKNEFVTIMGPSGSGKSTLLNILGCLDRPTSGSYHLDGEDVSTMTDDELSDVRSRKIGFIFQSYNLITQLSVIENIEVPLFYQGWSEHDSREKAVELAELVGLGDRTDHKPFELSGGQQQRVAVARSLANDPVMILADEPTGNLDSATGKEILNLLRDLHEQGKTIIMVTHDQSVASITQKIVNMKDGRVDNHSLVRNSHNQKQRVL